MVCCELLLEHIDADKNSVGTRVELDYVGATPLGRWVDISVSVSQVNGAAVTCDFSARAVVEEIAHGKHSRFVVGLEKGGRTTARQARQSGLAKSSSRSALFWPVQTL